ncbi:MAG TPA: response regulator [Polyangia bacterium]|nr:response regulator [Polyangia bacterium]
MSHLRAAETAPPPSLNSLLVVDDDIDMRESLRDVLTEEGYRVTMAADGEEALSLLAGMERPCGVLLDLVMPVMSGNEFYRAMSAVPALADIPVLVLTCHPSSAPPGLPKTAKTSLNRLLTMVAELFRN